MLAPQPVMPALMFADTVGQVGFNASLRPFPVEQGSTTSGLGVPFAQFSLVPMFRVNRRFVVGAALEYIAVEGAQYRNAVSAGLAGNTSAFGAIFATHFTFFEHELFGLDGALRLSLHGLPVAIGTPPGPLGMSTAATQGRSTAIPGGALSLVPRLSGAFGTIFVAVTAQTSADIDARGQQVAGPFPDDDPGSMRTGYGSVAAGYSYVAPFGLGVSAAVLVPFGAQRLGLTGPFASLGLFWAFGKSESKPEPRPPARPEPVVMPPPPLPANL